MATFYGPWVATDDFRAVLNVSVSNTSATQCTVSVTLQVQSVYGHVSSSGNASATVNGSTVSTSGFGFSTNSTKTVLTHSWTVARGASARSIGVSGRVWATGVSAYTGGSTASGSVTIPAIAYSAPARPTSCVAERVTDSRAAVTWSNGAVSTTTPRSATIVERQVDGGEWVQVATVGAQDASYTDDSTAEHHRYAWRVRAQGAGGTSDYATSGYVYTTPSAPTGCAAERVSDSSQRLTWGLGENAAYTYGGLLVERSTDDGEWVQVASLSAASTSWTDTTTAADHRYRYRVRSTVDSTTRLYSSWSTSGVVHTTPSAPDSVAISTSGTTVTVTPIGMGAWAESWDLERLADGETDWVRVASGVPSSQGSYEDQLSGSATYRVRCGVGTLLSGWTASERVTTIVVPASPTTVSPADGSVVDSTSDATLSWRHNPLDGSAQTRAEVQVSADGSLWETIEVEGADGSAQLDLSDYDGGRVWWRVRTWGSHENPSPWSSTSSFLAYRPPSVAIGCAGTLERFPFEVPWSYEDRDGSQASAVVTLSVSGSPVLELRANDSHGVEVRESDVALPTGTTVVVTLRATSTTGLSATATTSFVVSYLQPGPPELTLSVDHASLLVTVSVGAWPEDEGHLATAGIDVYRGEKLVASGLSDGGSATDYVPPLDVDLAYRAVSRSSVGSSSVSTAVATVPSRGAVAVNHGAALSRVAVLPFDVEVSESEASEREEFEAAAYETPVVAYGPHRTREGSASGSCDASLRPQSSSPSWRDALRAAGEHAVRLPGGDLFAASVEGERRMSGEVTADAFDLSVSWREVARDGVL